MACSPVGDEFEYGNFSSDVGNNISSRVEKIIVVESYNFVEPDVPIPPMCLVSTQRRQRRHMAVARRKASICHSVEIANSYVPYSTEYM